MRIAIAYDGSDYAEAAVADVYRSGLPRAAQALIVCAGETTIPVPPNVIDDLPRPVE